MEIEIIYEDDSILAINKPAGLLSHPRTKEDQRQSVASWLVARYPSVMKVGEADRPGIVHRLDKETSGIMLLARTQEAYTHLKKQFHDRLIDKTYVVLVYGSLKSKKGIVDSPLGALGARRTTRTSGKHDLKEQAAITEYRVNQTFTVGETIYSLLEAKPKTGRTHQIRVHLKSIGHPVVCDPLYRFRSQDCPSSLDRMFLHAQKIRFTSPDGKTLTLETDLPPELENFLKTIAK